MKKRFLKISNLTYVARNFTLKYNIQKSARVGVRLECSRNQLQIKQNIPSTPEDPLVSPNSRFHIYSTLIFNLMILHCSKT